MVSTTIKKKYQRKKWPGRFWPKYFIDKTFFLSQKEKKTNGKKIFRENKVEGINEDILVCHNHANQ